MVDFRVKHEQSSKSLSLVGQQTICAETICAPKNLKLVFEVNDENHVNAFL